MGAPKTKDEKSTVNEDKAATSFDPDAVLQLLGFGWFQVKFLVFMAYGMVFPQAAVLVWNFLSASPLHRCFVDGCDDPENPKLVAPWMGRYALGLLQMDANMTVDSRRWACTYPAFPPGTQNLSCATYYQPGTPCTDWIFHSEIIKSSLATDFDLVCDDRWKVTFGSFLTLLGILVGTIVLGPLPDVIGRKKAMAVCTVWMAAFGIGSAFAPNYDGFLGMRFFTGMAGQAAILAFGLWGMEAMAPSMRLLFYCAMGIASAIGNCLSGLAAYLIRDWRTLQLVIFIPFSCVIICCFFLPESARWLASKKRYEEAIEIFVAAAKLNKKTVPAELLVIPNETKEIQEAPPEQNPFRLFIQTLTTPCLLKRVVILFFIWFSQLLCNYGLSYASTNLAGDPYLSYVLVMLVDFPAIVILYFAVEKLGRRLIINVAVIAGGVSCLVAGLVDKEYTTVTTVFSLLGKFFVTIFATVNYTITVELFPTPSRSITVAMITTAGKIGSIVSPYIAALGKENRTLPYVIFGGFTLFAGILSLGLPETKGLPLPVTLQDAKDQDKTTLKLTTCSRNLRKTFSFNRDQ